jgi:hypothetical protein
MSAPPHRAGAAHLFGCPLHLLGHLWQGGPSDPRDRFGDGAPASGPPARLNDTQEGVITIAFQYADDNDLLLLDFKDLRSLLTHISTISSGHPAHLRQCRAGLASAPCSASS